MIYFSATILVVCGGLAVISHNTASHALLETVEENLPVKAEDAALLVKKGIESKLDVLNLIAMRSEIRTMNWELQLPVLQEDVHLSGYRRLGVANLSGVLVCNDNSTTLIKKEKFFKIALLGQGNISEPIFNGIDNSIATFIATPIKNNDLEVVGVLVAQLNGTALSRIMDDIQLGKSGYGFIINQKGTTIAHPDSEIVYKMNNDLEKKMSNPELAELVKLEQRMMVRETGFGRYLYRGKDKVMGFAPIEGTEWSIGVTAEQDEVLGRLNGMQRGIFFISLIFIVLGLVIAYYAGKEITYPLLIATERCGEMADGNFSNAFEKEWTERRDEIGLLMKGFNKINKNVSKMLEEIAYNTEHDRLTGFYNHLYFEKILHQYDKENICPVGIIVCDMDGLKLINDSFGYEAGDKLLLKCADMLRMHCPTGSVISRIDGDEFVCVLSLQDKEKVEQVYENLKKSVEQYNNKLPQIPINLSIGYSIKETAACKLYDIYEEADKYMCHHKLFSKQSAKSAIVHVVMKALETRDFVTEGHTDRLQGLVTVMAQEMSLADHQIDALCLLARFHDIGKVGVADSILFKPGKLTDEEFEEMKKHSEYGYNIACSAPDLSHIADWILKHHEWWNGNGYPLGLKGKEIPLECRILAIADAYDAMVNERPYRHAMPHNEAVEQIRKGAGTQFDEEMVSVFIRTMDNNEELI